MAKIREIQQIVADVFGISRDDIVGQRRAKELVFPRHMAFYLCRKFTNHSLPVIGQYFGFRHHTTVINGIKNMEKFLVKAEKFRELYDKFNGQLASKDG